MVTNNRQQNKQKWKGWKCLWTISWPKEAVAEVAKGVVARGKAKAKVVAAVPEFPVVVPLGGTTS